MTDDKPLPTDKLQRCIALAARMAEQKKEYKRLEEEAAAAKKAYTRTEREDLPMVFAELGIPSLTLPSGEIVKIADDATASITEENHNAAMKWLIDNGFGGLIKTAVIVEFNRGDRENAIALYNTLNDLGETPAVSESVHHSTLKSFVKERLREGEAVPHDLFGIHPFTKATIKKG